MGDPGRAKLRGTCSCEALAKSKPAKTPTPPTQKTGRRSEDKALTAKRVPGLGAGEAPIRLLPLTCTPTQNPHSSPTAACRRPALLGLMHSEAPAKVRTRIPNPAPPQTTQDSLKERARQTKVKVQPKGGRGWGREAQSLAGHLIGTPTGVGDREP